MVLAGESMMPEEDELRLMKSGRVRVALEGDRTEFWKRPTMGEIKFALERYSELVDEVKDEPDKVKMDVGPRWWTEVYAVLGPEFTGLPTIEERIQAAAAKGGKYDSDNAPSWTSQASVFMRLNRHWMEVPLVSDVADPEQPTVTVPTVPTTIPTEPVLLRQVISGGP